MPSNSIFLRSTYKDVLQSFCRWTSVRGLQHLVRSEHPVLRTIWAVFVALMFFANIGLVTMLLIHYYQFNTIENIRTLRGIQVEFPHITLCNVDPVNSYRVYCLQNPKAKGCNIQTKYSNILKKYQEANGYFKAYKDSAIWHKLEDPSMVAIFYQLIGMEAATQIGHQIDDFILPMFCEVTTREKGGIMVKRKCEEAGVHGLHLITYKYFNCYTLSMDDKHISHNTVRLSIILYLDEEEDLNCRPYCTHEFTEWAGGKIIVHSAGSYPDIEASGMNLLPGASNQILIDDMSRIEKKNMESKPCENNARNLSIVYFDHDKHKFSQRIMSYTDTLCIQLLSQRATMEECHCIDFLMPIPGTHMNLVNQLPFCGNLSRINVNESLACSQQVRQRNSKHFHHLCPIPCVKMQYNYELTQLRWPQKPRILNYYAQLKDRIDYNQKFSIYEKIEEISITNATQALTMLQHTDIFEKNFLQVDVNRPNFDTLISYRENEEYSLPTLLSQIGGICSIFLSFTCVTVLELIELFFRLIIIACPKFLAFSKNSLHYINKKTFKFGCNATTEKANNSSRITDDRYNRKISNSVNIKYEKDKFCNDISYYKNTEVKHSLNYDCEIDFLTENLLSTNNNDDGKKRKSMLHSEVDLPNCEINKRMANSFIQIHKPNGDDDDKCILYIPKINLINSKNVNTIHIINENNHAPNDSINKSHNRHLCKVNDIILCNFVNKNNESQNDIFSNNCIVHKLNKCRNSLKQIPRSVSLPDYVNLVDITSDNNYNYISCHNSVFIS